MHKESDAGRISQFIKIPIVIKFFDQVEETVWENRVRCEHRFTGSSSLHYNWRHHHSDHCHLRFSEKCHDTYITDYVPTQEEDCQTSFKKNCHITYKPTVHTGERYMFCNPPS